MSKKRKYIVFILTGFILFVLALPLLTQTAFFKEKAKLQLIKIVEQQINLHFEIEELDGNFFSNVILKNIKISETDSTVASISSLQVNYKLFPLYRKLIRVDSLIIENPQIKLWQNNDSLWNISNYLKVDSQLVAKESKPFNYRIRLEHFELRNASISVASFSKLIPLKTRQFNLIANGSYRKTRQRIQLEKLDFVSENPSLILNNFSGVFKMNEQGIRLDSLLLVTGGSNLNGNAVYISTENFNTNVEANPVDKDEISIFIPTIQLLCSPSLKTKITTVNDSISVLAELQYNNQSVVVNVSLNPFSHLLNKTEPIPYFANLDFLNFKLEDWIDTKHNHALIDGNVRVKGSNLFNIESPATIFADLNNSEYNQISFKTLLLNGLYSNKSLKAQLNVDSDFGDVQINGRLWNISKTPKYDVNIETDEFNVTAFIPQLNGTKINGSIQAKGSGFDVQHIETLAHLDLKKSVVYDFPVDSLNASFHLKKLQLNIDSMRLHVPGAFATGQGSLSLDSLILRSVVHANIDSLAVIKSIVVLPLQFESAKTTTSISGPLENLMIGGVVEIKNAEGYSVKLDSANANYTVSVNNDSVKVWVNTTASFVETGPVTWDTLKIDMNYYDNTVELDVDGLWKDTVYTRFKTRIEIGDTLSFELASLELNTLLSNYYLEDTATVVLLQENSFEIKDLKIKDHKKDDFLIRTNGFISTSDSNRLGMVVNQLDLGQFNRFIPNQDSLTGVLNSDFLITGTAVDPTITGTISINNPKFGTYSLSAVNANFNYEKQTGFAELITPDLTEFYARVSAPFKASFDSLEFLFSPPDTFNAELIIDSLQISKKLKSMIPNDSISGVLKANLRASGDYNNPLFYGGIKIENGHYVNKQLGVDYNHFLTSIVFDGKKILLDTVLIKQKSGLISITGEVEFDSTLIKGNIISSSLTADASNFFITQHRNYEVLIDAKTFIKTGSNNPEFGGKIKVIRSDIFLPAFMSDGKEIDDNDIPLLVQAAFPQADSLLLTTKNATDKAKNEKLRAAMLDNLTGRLNVEIPRNTWIKSNDMRIELRGDVDIIKTGRYFELFGNIDITRGYYILYGKKLKIKESQLIFQGGEKLDPNLNFIAEYTFRGSDKQKRYLELRVGGKMSEPDITFMLDGSEITETDGISIIIFGATSDELGYSGQNGIVGSVGSNAVASVITSKLSKTIGSQFNLDMIEVTATENWQSAAFMVGKYITNDIFVMYERGFGEVDGDEITPETITLEYELNELIFLRLQSGSSKTSGIDVILKLEQKKKK